MTAYNEVKIVLPSALWVREHHIRILLLAANGYTNDQIAARMNVSPDTVKSHWKTLKRRLDAKDRTHCVAIAIVRGWVRRAWIDTRAHEERS